MKRARKSRTIRDYFSRTDSETSAIEMPAMQSQSFSDCENSSPGHNKILRSSRNYEIQTLDSCGKIDTSFECQSFSTQLTDSQLNSNEDSQIIEDDNFRDFIHTKLDFILPKNIKDSKKRLSTHPDYDPSTLYVPSSFLSQQSPAMQQWWTLKSANFDTLLCFKVGKFYEFYHMDAMIVAKELSMTFMKGSFAHCGFPEIAFAKAANHLVKQGYKIARVEQTESTKAMSERTKTDRRKSSQVVNREICEITTPGTFTYDLESLNEDIISGPLNGYMYAVTELLDMSVCLVFVDVSQGRFFVRLCCPDRFYGTVRTCLINHPASQILCDRLKVSTELWNTLNMYGKCLIENASLNKYNTWSSLELVEYLKPHVERDILEKLKNPPFSRTMTSIGLLIGYLRFCLIDQELLSRREFVIVDEDCDRMVVDSSSALSLGIIGHIGNSGEETDSLFSCLDKCVTNSGRRMLRDWLLNPLKNITGINERVDAIEWISNGRCEDIINKIKQLPSDTQRMLMKIHSLSAKPVTHPENRAVLFEEDTYTRRKHSLLMKSANAILVMIDIIEEFELLEDCPIMLRRLLPSFKFENIREKLSRFESSTFESTESSPEFNEANNRVIEIQQKLEAYRADQEAKAKLSIKYVGTGRNRYQMEIRNDSTGHKLPACFILTSTKKNVSRYKTDWINKQLDELVEAEIKLDLARGSSFRWMLSTFDKDYCDWIKALDFVSVLDVLCSLAKWLQYCSSLFSDSVSRAEFVNNGCSYLEMLDSRHPILLYSSPSNLIPNDIKMGGIGDSPSTIVLTGPNMGGKSTLLRQVGISVWMAHVGIHVPCSKMVLSACDRIFTRIGAGIGDSTLGISTFFAEMAEIKPIVEVATHQSLVLIDELGRGTSTFDGTAIASAVLDRCVRLKCRVIFSTHYHSIVAEFEKRDVTLAHMSFTMNEKSNTITLLYRMDTSGPCNKSHGFNVAKLAGLPDEIISLAKKRSKYFEDLVKSKKMFRRLFKRYVGK